MGSFWFLSIFFMLLTTPSFSSSHVFQDDLHNKSQNHSTTTTANLNLLNLYHSNTKTPLKDLLTHDQNRVKSLQNSLKTTTTTTTYSPLKSTSNNKIPLSSGLSIGSGNYYVKVGLGSPAKYYPMLVDTGSSLSWVQCQPCRVYCHSQSGPVFDPAGSSSYTAVPCAEPECKATKRATLNDPFCSADKTCVYTASYGDSSFSVGYLGRDRLSLSNSQSLSGFVYGCGQDNQGLFGMSAGILGLARDRLSLSYQAAGKFGRGFSYCLPTAEGSRGSGGFLSLGASIPHGSKFTPLITDQKNPSLYFLDLTALTVGSNKTITPQPGSTTILDSGTVITRLPRVTYTALRDSFKAAVAGKLAAAPAFSILDACFKAKMGVAAKVVPVIRLRFRGGAEVVVGAENALVDAGGGIVCLGFAATDGVAIIGNRQQQRYTVVYDVDRSRIGFAYGGCT